MSDKGQDMVRAYALGAQVEHEVVEDLEERIERLEELLRMVIFFYRPGPIAAEDVVKWVHIVGQADMTTKALCDGIRRALEDQP